MSNKSIWMEIAVFEVLGGDHMSKMSVGSLIGRRGRSFTCQKSATVVGRGPCEEM